MVKTQLEILIAYNAKTDELKKQIYNVEKLVNQLSYRRIVLFLLEILFFVLFLNTGEGIWRTITGVCLLIPVVFFMLIVKRQSQLDKDIHYLKQLLWVYQNEVNVLTGQKNGYDHGGCFESSLHPYSADLDIFGDASLFALINRSATKKGNTILAENLAEANDLELINQRQEAIKEMLNVIDETYDFRAKLYGHDNGKIEEIKFQLKNNLSNLLKFSRKKIIRAYVIITPFVAIILVLTALFYNHKYWSLLGLLFAFNIGVIAFYGGRINKVYYSFSGGSSLLNNYSTALKWIEKQNWSSSYILNLFDSKEPVSDEISVLSKIIQNFDARLNVVVGSFLNGFFLWDLKCCINLDKWHHTSSAHVVSGLDRIGDFEDLIAFATLSYNNPGWCYPELKVSHTLDAVEIGHPLISKNQSVENTFMMEQQPTVDIVTGSNMAGKSTFLRTIGINTVLAYAGAPVYAKSLSLSVFKVLTYMRIKDSLNESTSTFKAELNRLKMILENVNEHQNAFVLIDEMLRGTNSKDKYLGSKVFIQKLISTGTPALFATHDLQLSELKETYQKEVRNFHFDIQITEGEMEFDYKLKQGPCATFNAAILLKEIGLALD